MIDPLGFRSIFGGSEISKQSATRLCSLTELPVLSAQFLTRLGRQIRLTDARARDAVAGLIVFFVCSAVLVRPVCFFFFALGFGLGSVLCKAASPPNGSLPCCGEVYRRIYRHILLWLVGGWVWLVALYLRGVHCNIGLFYRTNHIVSHDCTVYFICGHSVYIVLPSSGDTP